MSNYRQSSGHSNGRTHNSQYIYADYGEASATHMSLEQETTNRIVSILYQLGDKGDVQRSIEQSIPVLEKEFYNNKTQFLEAFRICLIRVPHKTGIYATVTGLLNVRNFDTAKEILLFVAATLNAALMDVHLRSAKILVRFFAECVNANVVLPGQLVALWDVLLSVTLEPDVRQERADAFIFIVLASIPYVATQLNDRSPEHLTRIVNGMDAHFSKRAARAAQVGLADAFNALALYQVGEGEPYKQLDKLDLLWIQIQDLKSKGWEVPILPKVHELFEDVLGQELQHDIPSVDIPSTLTSIKFCYQPKIWIFDDSLSEGETAWAHLPRTKDITRFILDDAITDLIRIFSLNHKECSLLLLHLDVHFNREYLSKEGYSIVEAVIECLFAELFRLPKSQERIVYYETLIVDLCKDSLDKVPIVFGRAIKTLYSRLDSGNNFTRGMDVEGIRRLAELFAHHLSNFGFQWNWQAWEDVLSKDPLQGQFIFVRETLEHCIRLSYYDRIKNIIPESFEKHGLIFPQSPPSYNFLYDTAESSGDEGLCQLAGFISKSISERADLHTMEAILTKVEQYASAETIEIDGKSLTIEMAMSSPESVTRDVFINCVMFQGSKSFSHILNVIERYLPLLQKCNRTVEARMHTLEITAAFWKGNTQFIEIVLDKLTNYRIVDPKTVLLWIFQPKILDVSFSRFYLWSILRNTLIKVNLKAEQISLRLETAKSQASNFSDMTAQGGEIQTLEMAREAALREKKETFLLVFQKYVELTSSKLRQCMAEGIEPTATPWWRWVVGFFREISRAFKTDVEQIKFTVDAIIFTPDLDSAVVQLWTELKSFSELHGDDVE
ncbi:hypothetical protein BASA50_011044 [Batrachochytrium salamandrivorans]|uniref:MIF4G domain-containing protein n=1 Tax=Batrachochytrium salamandrivorans TaxID=1357716 RepID=A0ABQ8EWP6_9FUNG|nr:hypothetical protein BASA50_011044 [Batrachochytrium salamandrivorans]KAH9265343.1 hypothetical protein BASA83_011155 [Batrachochytrium salamandrivorans]